MRLFLARLGVILIIGIVIFGCAGKRGEGSWKSFSSTDLYEGFYYISQSHLLHKPTLVVSVRLEYKKKGLAEDLWEFGKAYKNLSYSLQSWEVDCRAAKERILSSDQYSVEGNLIHTKLPRGSFLRSFGKSLSKAVCR